MFKFLLAFIIWLFATGEYSKWIALVQSPTGSPSPSGTGANSPGNVLGGLGSLGGLVNSLDANSSAGGTSTPADLISGYTG